MLILCEKSSCSLILFILYFLVYTFLLLNGTKYLKMLFDDETFYEDQFRCYGIDENNSRLLSVWILLPAGGGSLRMGFHWNK